MPAHTCLAREDELKLIEPIPEEVESIGKAIVDSAFRVHRELGPGLLESVYEACLRHELGKRRIPYVTQKAVPIVYDEVFLRDPLILDLLVADAVIVEVKSVEKLLLVHEAQLLTYLKLAKKRLGFLINFNSALIRDGIRRRVI